MDNLLKQAEAQSNWFERKLLVARLNESVLYRSSSIDFIREKQNALCENLTALETTAKGQIKC